MLFNGALGTPTSGTLTNCTFPTLNQNTSGTAASITGNLTGDVTSTGMATSISGLALTKLASIANNTVLGNISGGSAAPSALTSPTLTALTLTALAALTTPAESWVGPSSTAGIYFKGGNVGIGTTGPIDILQLDRAAANVFTTYYIGGVFKGGLGAVCTPGALIDSSAANDFGIRSQSNLLFAAGGSVEGMRLTSTGNVGIGTTSPGYLLTVNGTAAASSLYTTPIAVASLPSAATAGAGARYCVNNALAPVFGSTVAGGGAVNVPVYSDGTNWKVG